MAKSKVTDKDKGMKKALASLERLAKRGGFTIDVGFADEKNAKKAKFNELGTKDIPERPFMRTAFDRNMKKYNAMSRRSLASIASGQRTLERFEDVIAQEMSDDLVESIKTWRTPPNTTATAREKGFNDPLVNTGEMQAAVVVSIRRGRR